jgi:Zn-dependent peptidase ImmA (M78 family)
MPKIKYKILSWARKTSKLSISEAAHKLQLTDSKELSAVEKLTAYEDGTKDPSRSLLIRMSKVYHRPLLTFYLDEPPNVGDRGEDFRTLPDDFSETDNAYIDVLIRDIRARQSTVRETLIDEDEEIHLEFIGKNTIDQGVTSIVQTIRDTLQISLDDYRAQPNHKEAFKLLRQRTEAAGIFVLLKGNLGSHHSNIDVAAFRGFALSDDIAPFIVINDRDAEAAWSFTLIHEMAHLILGKTGISGAFAEKNIEKFCNNVASEFLLPTPEFEAHEFSNQDFESLVTDITNYAFSKKLSSSHIAYRLYRQGTINKTVWEKLSEYYRGKWLEQREVTKVKNNQTEGGPSYYVVQYYKLGALVDLVRRMTYSGAITTTKAGMLLDVKPLKVHRLFQTGQVA